LQAKLPILLCAPTWRTDQARIQQAGFDLSLNRDAVLFMKGLQKEWQHEHSPLFIGGLIGPQNDCYSPAEALNVSDAKEFHTWQAEELSAAGADIIIAQTIPSVSEAIGMAEALSQTDTPYIISFVINRFARILDGTSLAEAIKNIDNSVSKPPVGYMVNCVYPTFLKAPEQSSDFFKRLIGIQANSSSKDHDLLDGSETLQQDPLADWGDRMLELNRKFGVKILGGCCGTDNSHLDYLVNEGK
jgi:homocysteine S-methyltransferase